MRSLIRRFAGDTCGATSIEYALLGVLIALVVIGAIASVGTSVNTMVNSAANAVK